MGCAALVVVAAACGSAGTGTDTELFRIAVVAPSAADDLAFTQSMVDALSVLRAERGVDSTDVAVTDGAARIDVAAAALRAYAEDGFDLVIAHGSQYGESVAEIATDHPDVAFAWGTAATTFDLPNVFAYNAAADQGGYVLGVLAAGLSESGSIGVVGPIELGDAALYVAGFTAGVVATRPDARVVVDFTGSFSDVSLAARTATRQIDGGADVLTGSAQMVAGAVGVASERGVLWLGTQADQTSLAPDLVVASQVYHWEVVIAEIMARVEAGTLGGVAFELSLANGGLVIAYNDNFELPASARQAADAAAIGLANGRLATGA